MSTQVTSDYLRNVLVQAVAQDPRSEGSMHKVGAAIWPRHRPDILTGANWELVEWTAITSLPPECQAAIYDAVDDAKVKYSLQSDHFPGGSAAPF